MKSMRSLLIGLACLTTATTGFTQDQIITNATSYNTELFGSVATANNTPFWMVNNQYGKVPLDPNNSVL